MITLSKTFATDNSVYSIVPIINSNGFNTTDDIYTATIATKLALKACDMATLTVLTNGAFDVASDCLFIKSITTTDGTKSYAKSEATAIKKYSTVSIYTAKRKTTVAKAVLFTDEVLADDDAARMEIDKLNPYSIIRCCKQSYCIRPEYCLWHSYSSR